MFISNTLKPRIASSLMDDLVSLHMGGGLDQHTQLPVGNQ